MRERSDQFSKLVVHYRQTSTLKEPPQNARTHSKQQINQIANSIREFGFTCPLLVDDSNTVIAGNGRLAAARLIGLTELPTISLDKLTPTQIKAYALADNKLSENAGWDREILAIELQQLLSIESDFDIALTGFETAEIDLILQESAHPPDPDNELPAVDTAMLVNATGDLWALGKHRLLCGNSLEGASFATLMGRRKANLVFTDPPFNVSIDGNACGRGSIHHREFAMASGELTATEFTAFLATSLGLMAEYSSPGSVHFVCHDWRHINELLAAGKQVYSTLLNLVVWTKDNGGLGSFYRSQHELIFVFRNGQQSHRNNVLLGKYGRNRTNVWQYPGINTLSKQSEEGNLLALHPTVKPVAMVADAILDCSARGDIVLDAFLGSGTTLLAAERTGRTCYGLEIDPIYCDVIIKRWQRLTGGVAIHSLSGETFNTLHANREGSLG